MISYDTGKRTITIGPVSGDNWGNLQSVINYSIQNAYEIKLINGSYPISKPLIFAKIQGDYKQVTPRFSGAVNSKNCPDQNCTIIIPQFNDKPAIIVQLGKGGYLKDFQLKGSFLPPINIYDREAWGNENTVSPPCGIAFDPFSDGLSFKYPGLESYYLPGMSRSGSTAVKCEGLSIKNFPLGFIVSPSNQQNGEIIHLYHSQIQGCKTAYALCQAQSKQCEVKDLEIWDSVYTIFDNVTYGVRHGDGAGSPMVDGVNIASNINQIFRINNQSFHGSFNNIYGEGVFKLGWLGGNTGACLSNSEIDFSNSNPGTPSPDYYLLSNNTIYQNCILRLYPGKPGNRITLNGSNNMFLGGQQTGPPLCLGSDQVRRSPTITGMAQYYDNNIINTSDYDKVAFLTTTSLHLTGNWEGWFGRDNISAERGDFNLIKPGDCITTGLDLSDLTYKSWTYPVGFVSKVEDNKVYLTNVGYFLKEGPITIYCIQYEA